MEFTFDIPMLTWYQALQLLALGPCLFMLFFLCVVARKPAQSFVPASYFLSLACSFFLPLSVLFTVEDQVTGILLMGESLTPALSFLLIMQFLIGGIPRPIYWAILAVPLVGGGSLVYAMLIVKTEVCIEGNIFFSQICAEPELLKQLYEIFSDSLTFLLTIILYSRLTQGKENLSYKRRQQHVLMLALIMLNLMLLGINLAHISGVIDGVKAALTSTIIRISFIYMVLTLVFRVFDRSFEIAFDRVPHLKPAMPSPRDLELADKIRVLLAQDKIYRSMDLSRESLAKKLAVSEHALSRIVNQCFQQSVVALINHYRIEEAKERLVQDDMSVTSIAFEVGFSSIPSFNRVFKQLAGMPPSTYRTLQKAPSH